MKKSIQFTQEGIGAGPGQFANNVSQEQSKTETDLATGFPKNNNQQSSENAMDRKEGAPVPAAEVPDPASETPAPAPEIPTAAENPIATSNFPLPAKSAVDLEVQAGSIAVVCHAANAAFCAINGDQSQLPWEKAPIWQRQSAIDGVKFRLANPEAKPIDRHEVWRKAKVDAGWVYGPVKNDVKKTHPCLMEYNKLPEFQRKKDVLFMAIVDILSDRFNF